MIFKLIFLSVIITIGFAQHRLDWNQQSNQPGGEIYRLGPRDDKLRNTTTTKAPETESTSQFIDPEPGQEDAEENEETLQQVVQQQQVEEPKPPKPTKEAKTTTDEPNKTSKATTRRLTTQEYSKFQQDLRRFCAAIYHSIIMLKDGNTFFSPLSIAHAIGMVNAGAKGNSSTQLIKSLQMEETGSNYIINAGFRKITADKFKLQKKEVATLMASRSFMNTGFEVLPEYIIALHEFYYSVAETINFGNPKLASERINNWVEEQTNGLIKDLVPEDVITPLTRLILVNALYFKAPWTSVFQELPPDDFTTPSGVVKVPYLTNKLICRRKKTDDYEYLAIPYQDRQTYFVVVMPKSDEAMKKFEREKNLEEFFKFLRRRVTKDWSNEKIIVKLPPFTLEKSLDVKPVLMEMGVSDIFNSHKADLSGISEEFIYVTDFLHKAKITVTKDGTEAAAATAAAAAARVMQRVDTVHINRPFIFAIYERGNILFMGKMVSPSGK